MNVQIKTVFGEMSFDMTQENVLILINQAISYANGDRNNVAAPVTKDTELAQPRAVAHISYEHQAEDKPAHALAVKNAPQSRVETMFGNRSAWNMPAAGKGNAERPDGQEGYKGFLYVRCENCGEVKGYNGRQPQTYFQCKCGHRTELRNLRPAHVYCKCGRSFTYKTNIETDFTMNCMACGSPVDLELGAKGTAFVTIGQKFGGGVKTNDKPVSARKPYYL